MRNFLILLVAVVLLGASAYAQTTNTLSAVQFADATTVFASGVSGTILRSNDGGINWENQYSGTGNYLSAISFTSASTGTIVGGNPLSGGQTILRTTNGGTTWVPQSTGTATVLKGVHFVDANTGWVTGDNGSIFRTTDGGITWGQQSSGITETLDDIKFTDVNTGTAVGTWGRILRTTDGGTTWTPQSSGTNAYLNRESFVNSSTGTVVGNGGTILRTTNGGSTWSMQSSGTSFNLTAVHFVDANTGFAVGWYGTILRTTNGGAAWTSQASGTTNHLSGVSFLDASTGIAVGLNGTILRTTNGGATWGPPSGGGGTTPPATPTLSSPADGATNQSTTLTLNWNASSGASTYRLQVSTSSSFASTAYDNASLTSTSQSVGPLATSTTYYWHVSASNSAGTSSYSSTWSFTTNSGGPLFSVSPTSISFGTVFTGTTKADSVTVSNGGGSTLTITSILSSSSMYRVTPTAATIAAGASQKIYITFAPTNKKTVSASITFTHNAPGSPSSISVTGTGASAPRGKGPTVKLASIDEAALDQNYPNPFNPSTVIGYYLPEESMVNLTVYNIIGQEISTLVNEVVGAGYHTAAWNAANIDGAALPSGTYIYRLQAASLSSGEVTTHFGKMQLLK